MHHYQALGLWPEACYVTTEPKIFDLLLPVIFPTQCHHTICKPIPSILISKYLGTVDVVKLPCFIAHLKCRMGPFARGHRDNTI